MYILVYMHVVFILLQYRDVNEEAIFVVENDDDQERDQTAWREHKVNVLLVCCQE